MMPDFILLPDDRRTKELREQLKLKLEEYKQRREHYRRGKWNESSQMFHRFWWANVNTKIDVIERLFDSPGKKVVLCDLLAEYRQDEEKSTWTGFYFDNREPALEAFGVVFQYVSGQRALSS